MNNQKVRLALQKNGVRQYELALLLGVSEATLGRKLRVELPEDEQDRLVTLIAGEGARKWTNTKSL